MFSKKFQRKYALTDQGVKNTKKGAFWTVIVNLVVMGGMGILYLLMYGLMGTLTDGAPLPGPALFLGLVIAFVILSFVTHLQQYRATYGLVYNEVKATRLSLAERLRRLPLGYFGKRDLADLTETLMGDVNRMEHVWSHVLGYLYGAYISTAIIAVCLLVYDWRLTIACLWGVPVAFGLLFGTRKISARASERTKQAAIRVSDGIQEALENVREIRATNQEVRYLAGLNQKIDDHEKVTIQGELGTGIFVNAASVIMRLGVATTILAGASLILSGQIDFMLLFLFLLVITRVYAPFDQSLALIAELFVSQVSADRMNEIYDTPTAEGAEVFQPKGHDIVFDHVGFAYDKKKVLDGVSFTAREGEVTALVGPSGSGKSTCARLAARLWDATEGTIRVGGNAFAGNLFLKSVSYPTTLERIGTKAFFGCENLKDYYFNGMTAPLLETTVSLTGAYANVALYANFVGLWGTTGTGGFVYNDWGLNLYYPQGAVGYTAYVWDKYFNTEKGSVNIMDESYFTPTDLTVTETGVRNALLTWTAAKQSNAEDIVYKVERSVAAHFQDDTQDTWTFEGFETLAEGLTACTYTDTTTLPFGRSYAYRVTAYSLTGETGPAAIGYLYIDADPNNADEMAVLELIKKIEALKPIENLTNEDEAYLRQLLAEYNALTDAQKELVYNYATLLAALEKAGHNPELKNAKPATCTEDGYTGDEVCTVCGETVKKGETIPAAGHDYKDGKCTVCGETDPNYKPDEPVQPENPGVKTGDEAHTALWLAAASVSLLAAAALLLGGCTAGPQPAESAQPEETLTQEQIDAISEKYGLESPTPHTPPMDMDWGWSVKNP